MIIAIDGLVATGKGTTAQGVARALGYTYIDTGAMYRAAARIARDRDMLDASDECLVSLLDEHTIEFIWNEETQHDDVWIDGKNRESDIRSTDLALVMRPIVICRPLRARMVELQQELARGENVVGDGRDMGTVAFPDAEYKYFLTCDLDVRVARRSKQLREQGLDVDEEKIRAEIILRDETDYLGPDAVNKKSPDAQVIDTTYLTIDEQIAMIVEDVRRG